MNTSFDTRRFLLAALMSVCVLQGSVISRAAERAFKTHVLTRAEFDVRSGKAADLLVSNGFKVLGTIGAQVYESDGGTLSKITPQR